MAYTFKEHEYPAGNIVDDIEVMLMMIANKYKISYSTPPFDMARRFLNEIVEFKPEVEKC